MSEQIIQTLLKIDRRLSRLEKELKSFCECAPGPERWLGLRKAADELGALGVTERMLRDWRDRGKFPECFSKTPSTGKVLFDVNAYLAQVNKARDAEIKRIKREDAPLELGAAA